MVLKVEARLKLHHASRQCVLRATEVRAVDLWREEPKRRQVQTVECIEEVSLELQKRSFTKKRGQTGSLGKTEVYREVSWTTKRVTPDARRQHAVGIIRIEKLQAAARKVSAGANERFVVSIFKRAAEVSRWTRRTNEVVRICRTHALACMRRPGKTGMCRHYAVDLPAPKRLTDEIPATT